VKHADRDRRAPRRPAAFRDLLEKRAAERDSGGHHPLRRSDRSAPHRGAGRGVSRRAGPAQPAGPGQHRGELEFGFATPSYVICESVHGDVPWRADVVKEGFTVEKKGRIVRPNTRPGLGIEINEAEVRRSTRSSRKILQRVFYRTAAWVTGEPAIR
jgi:galactonate dehydratase